MQHVPQRNNHLVYRVIQKRQDVCPYLQKGSTEKHMPQIQETHLQLLANQPEKSWHYVTACNDVLIVKGPLWKGKDYMELLEHLVQTLYEAHRLER
jgi:hypothetical protein